MCATVRMNFFLVKFSGATMLVLLAGLACGTARAQQQPVKGNATQSSATQDANAQPASADAKRTIAKKLRMNGVPNFGEVSPQLFRGGQPSSEGIEALARMGIGIIVNLRTGEHPEEQQEATKLGMQYISIPWHCYHPNDTAIAEFLSVLRENPGKKIFVHCELGSDRTGMSIAAHRMSNQGWAAEEAMREMRAFGFSASHHLTCRGLATYEKNFPDEFKQSTEFENLRSVQPGGDPQVKP